MDLQNSLVAHLWRLVGPEPRSVTNRLEYSTHCANPLLRNTYIRHGHHHGQLQGRALAARLKGGFFRSVCLLYVPSSSDHKLHRKEEGIGGLWNVCWNGVDGCLSEQKHRTTPVVLMDANDGIGLGLRAGRYRPVYCQCIAAAGARRKHVAAKRLREIMEKHPYEDHLG